MDFRTYRPPPQASNFVVGGENGRAWLALPKISAHNGGEEVIPVPRFQLEGLCQEQTADVECTKHVPVPHAMPVLLAMVMVAHIVLELGSDVLRTPSTYHPFFSAPRVRTEAATAGCAHCMALGTTSWLSCLLCARLAWVVDWVAIHVELGRAELICPHAHSLFAAHSCIKEPLGWTFDMLLYSAKNIGRSTVSVQEQRFLVTRSRGTQAIDLTVESSLRVNRCAKTQVPDLALLSKSPQRFPVL